MKHKDLRILQLIILFNSEKVGAGRENRTLTLLPEPDFESGASTSSATPAR